MSGLHFSCGSCGFPRYETSLVNCQVCPNCGWTGDIVSSRSTVPDPPSKRRSLKSRLLSGE